MPPPPVNSVPQYPSDHESAEPDSPSGNVAADLTHKTKPKLVRLLLTRAEGPTKPRESAATAPTSVGRIYRSLCRFDLN